MFKKVVITVFATATISQGATPEEACKLLVNSLDKCSTLQGYCELAEQAATTGMIRGGASYSEAVEIGKMCRIACENPVVYRANRQSIFNSCVNKLGGK